jgi:hypothetical protein
MQVSPAMALGGAAHDLQLLVCLALRAVTGSVAGQRSSNLRATRPAVQGQVGDRGSGHVIGVASKERTRELLRCWGRTPRCGAPTRRRVEDWHSRLCVSQLVVRLAHSHGRDAGGGPRPSATHRRGGNASSPERSASPPRRVAFAQSLCIGVTSLCRRNPYADSRVCSAPTGSMGSA